MNNDTDLFFATKILEEVEVVIDEEEYTLPAVKHPNTDALTSLYAAVIKLHQKVQELEEKLGKKRTLR